MDNVFPEWLYIGGLNYGIEFSDDSFFNDNYHGVYDSKGQMIRISDDISYPKQVETLLHEVFHGVEELMGLELDEFVIRSMSRGLFSVLVENPEISEAILAVAYG